jgi:hypothetical protein
MKKFVVPGVCIMVLVAIAAWAPDAQAFKFYSDNVNDVGQCAQCHTGFRQDSDYVSQAEGSLLWGGKSLHQAHLDNTDVDASCDNCHGGADITAVRMVNLSSSGTGAGTAPAISCSGCHGRLEDENTVTENGTGWGAGLRQHHNGAGVGLCLTCHADSDPAAFTTAGEDTMPPYYAFVTNGRVNTTMEPCSMTDTEYLEGLTIGLDNDGDGVYDMADPDCSGVVETPGESSAIGLQPLLVNAYDPAGGTMTLTFEAGCASTDHNLEWGPLTQVSTHGYSAQTVNECGIGAAGPYVWSFPATPDDIFFLVVGNDGGTAEGSLGLETAGERPENSGGICDIAQSLTDRCD